MRKRKYKSKQELRKEKYGCNGICYTQNYMCSAIEFCKSQNRGIHIARIISNILSITASIVAMITSVIVMIECVL